MQNTISPQGGNISIARNPKKKQFKTLNWLNPFFGKHLVGAVSCCSFRSYGRTRFVPLIFLLVHCHLALPLVQPEHSSFQHVVFW